MERIRGVVERITYANEETGYSVVKLQVHGYSELVTIVGSMASVNVGSVVEAYGNWTHNAKFGRQFEAKEWKEQLPATIYGIEKYLGSGLIKGIGPVYAKKIVRQFRENTLDVLEGDPEQLRQIDGIGPKRVALIKEAWAEQKEVKNIMLFLQSHGISTAFGNRIFKAYGNQSLQVIQENPYKMADDIFGIGFKTADALAQKLGLDPHSTLRCRSGIFYVLNQLADEGHCYATAEQLETAAVELLVIDAAMVKDVVQQLLHNEELVIEDKAIYLPPFYYSEEGTANRLRDIFTAPTVTALFGDALPPPAANVTYDDVQQKAIDLAQTSKIMILTGGPGTGKTTTIQGILGVVQQARKRVLLAAPTGRAAKRMTETTGMEAKTIHRLLEFSPAEGYKRNPDNPLLVDVLIVDEVSMIDVVLMYNLLKAIPDTAAVIFVGDVDQLPSVGPGSVLADMIASGVLPTIKLERIFRQAQGSRIITNAHRINRGQEPDLSGGPSSNFFFIDEQEDIPGLIVELCARRLPAYYHFDAVRDIQVLTPMQRTDTGAANLNALLQQALNRNTLHLKRGSTEYRLHDKVMQIRNNYDKEVFNGDIGQICAVDLEERTLQVMYDNRRVNYEALELDELVLAYATTIHKAQGSEYRAVVLPFSFSHYVMLQRNLLYTGITRAKELVVMVGDRKAVRAAIRNAKVARRNTNLAQRLRDKLTDAQ